MRRVAILGADFAPSGLPPALRLRFFAAHLPAFGWEPIVVTTAPRHYDWPTDPENCRLLPAGLRVLRTGALPARLARRVGVGDVGMRSMPQHWLALAALRLRQQIDALLIPVPPYMPMVLGRLLHAQFGLPYVVDYIDPWVTDYYWKLPPAQRPPKWALANALARICEPFALRRAGHIVGVSRGTTDGVLARYPWLGPADASEIPYGGEPADFAYLRARPRPNPIFRRDDGLLHVCHVGRGGPDMWPALRGLFAALRLGLARWPELFGRLRLHFVGTSYAQPPAEQVRPLAHELGLGHLVDEHAARLPYLDALQVLLDAHALLAVGSEEPHYTASKIFPYILAGRPLLALFHEASSVLATLAATGVGAGIGFGPGRPPEALAPEIAAALAGCLRAAAAPPAAPDLEAFAPYTARAMAGRLAQALDAALERGR